MTDTIFALSSGAPPAAIAVVRVSGPAAGVTMGRLAGRRAAPRRATLVSLRDPRESELVDRALLLWFPGPTSSTGEDVVEFHVHGGRAVADALLAILSRESGLRHALPGEFTRRAFANGRIDLTEAEGLADLLAAETESQRRHAIRMADGALHHKIIAWQDALLAAGARIEAVFDFGDEEDVPTDLAPAYAAAARVRLEMQIQLAAPRAERLRDGVRVVIAGPPNAGKSTLLNALVGREAAIVSELAGTTRDIIEVPVAVGGIAYLLIDSAGLREGEEPIERIGIERARRALADADIVLWLGEPDQCPAPERSILVHARADERGGALKRSPRLELSARTGEGIEELLAELARRANLLLPAEGEVALNRRQREQLLEAATALHPTEHDPLLFAEQLRASLAALDRLTGRAGVEAMLDALFGRFCIGK